MNVLSWTVERLHRLTWSDIPQKMHVFLTRYTTAVVKLETHAYLCQPSLQLGPVLS